jgi:heat shock protein HslJ
MLTILIFGLSCNTTKKSTVKEVEALGSKFQVKKMEASTVELKVEPTMSLDFTKNTISGNAGCNQYSSEFTRKGNQIKFGPIIATKMFCGNMKIEKEFFKKLETITSFATKDNQFLLYNNAKELVLTCEAEK